MLLVMDVGNTNIKIAVFENEISKASWRISSKVSRTADELGMVLLDLFNSINIGFNDIDGVIVASVTPSLNYTLEHAFSHYMGLKPIMVNSKIKTGLKFEYDNPSELGADRIACAACAYHIYGGPTIVVDFGSATTFGAITEKGEFLGGAIAPGLKTASEAMVANGSKLTKFELIKPEKVIGKNTLDNMRSGIINGFTGLAKNMIDQMKKETGYDNVKVIATGGLGELLADKEWIDVYDRGLSLKGLRIIYELNRKENIL